ncbi:unnamed protein product [Ostreobium quekettii]|uniref:Uncharacterized protein n=1 Tax=Ostreobium quekettii TaxID=121088 RepID=A0A8S1IPW8_9CHLO|nr:unnamed protein product [Ostreobium quekettii]
MDGVDGTADEGGEGGDGEDHCLYGNFDLVTPRRKVSQACFLKSKIREAKMQFNAEFQKVVARKASDIDKIEEVNGRIRDINKDLQKLGGPAPPELTSSPMYLDMEDTEALLTVKDEEVTVERYLSPEEHERLEEERRQEEQRLLESQKNNIFERALKQMMGGTLEKKGEGDDEFLLVIPEWMAGDPSTFSEDQLKEYCEIQAKQKAIEEEKARRRAALEAELRTLRASIEDIKDKFDKQIAELHNHYLSTVWNILEMELYIVSLLTSVNKLSEIQESSDSAVLESLAALKEKKRKISQTRQDFRAVVNDQKERVNALSQEDRQMERSFKKELSDARDHYARLHQLYKWRGERAASTSDRDPDDLDPFPPMPTADGSHGVPHLDSSMCPEGLLPVLWEKLLDQREARIQHEQHMRQEQDSLRRMEAQLQKLDERDRELETAMDQGVAELNKLKEQRLANTLNLEYPITLKQGQVEVQAEGVLSILSNSALIDRKTVEGLNDIIQGKGGKKVAILTAIKDFKKGIYQLEWENEGYDMKAEDLVERTKEFQLLRVSKSVHQVVKLGEGALKSQEAANLEQLMKFNEALHKKNVSERAKRLDDLEKEIMAKGMQNEQMKAEMAGIYGQHREHTRLQHFLSGAKKPSKRFAQKQVKSVTHTRQDNTLVCLQRQRRHVHGKVLLRERAGRISAFFWMPSFDA